MPRCGPLEPRDGRTAPRGEYLTVTMSWAYDDRLVISSFAHHAQFGGEASSQGLSHEPSERQPWGSKAAGAKTGWRRGGKHDKSCILRRA